MKHTKSNVQALTIIAILIVIILGCSVFLLQRSHVRINGTKNSASQQMTSKLKISGLTFTLPNGWNVKNIETTQNNMDSFEVANIQVPDQKYTVIIPVSVLVSDYAIQNSDQLLKQTPSGAKIYANTCAPALACYYIVLDGMTYDITFEMPQSNQPAPQDVSGVWFPNTSVTAIDTLNFVSTVTKK